MKPLRGSMDSGFSKLSGNKKVFKMPSSHTKNQQSVPNLKIAAPMAFGIRESLDKGGLRESKEFRRFTMAEKSD